ncbi:MAG: DoxX family protein [Candidatus Paceibacterota bacterium]
METTVFLFMLGRIFLGGYFIMNGVNHFKNAKSMGPYAASKGVPMPEMSVYVTGVMLLLGGFGILFGVYVEVAILLLILFLVATLVKMHTYWTITDPMARMGEHINFYKNLALIGALLMLLSIPLPWVNSLF